MKKVLILCCAAMALATGCASPGAPQPPSLRLPQPVENLSAARKGNRVILTWSPSTQTTDRLPMRWPSTTNICRVVNRFPITGCGQPVATMPNGEALNAQRAVVSFEDAPPLAVIAAQNQATYALELVNQRGRSAGLSNQVRVSLAPAVPPPTSFRASLDAEGPLLQWEMAAPSLPPGATCLLRIDRHSAGAAGQARSFIFEPIAQQPCSAGRGRLRDANFEWEHEYDYKAVAVLVIPNQPPMQIEGDDSPLAHLVAHDVFPPAIPSGVQAVYSSVGQKPFIDLTWSPNTESDLAGYVVYRSSGGSPFVAVTPALLKATAWRDEDVCAGVTYAYAVAAADVRGNQSAQSAPARESVPQQPSEGLPAIPQEAR